MKIQLMKQSDYKIYDITQMTESVEWAGSMDSVARTADITILNAPYDHNVSAFPRPVTGDYIALAEDKEIFYGRVYGIEKTSEDGTVTVNCIDDLQRLLGSKGKYNFKGTTPEAIAAQVLADVQFPVGELASTGAAIKSMVCDGDTVYDIIMQAYTQAHKANQKPYMCCMRDRRLAVIPKGWVVSSFRLSEKLNITHSAFSESTNSLVNHIRIFNDKGVQVGEVSNQDSIGRYGMFTELYTVEDGISPQTAATGMLVGPEQSLSVEAIGNMDCLSGRGVTLEDAATGMKGLYWIKSDKHSFKDGTHMMELELSFKNLMDEKESQEEGDGQK